LIVATIRFGNSRFLAPKSPTALQHDGVLVVVKAWPIEAGACDPSTATASLDDVCARRLARRQVGTKKRFLGRTKKLTRPGRPSVSSRGGANRRW
jgi:hypothetical protein